MIFVLVGNFCMIAFGTIRGMDFKKEWKMEVSLSVKMENRISYHSLLAAGFLYF